MKIFKIIKNNIISTIYPKKCICCGEIIDEDQFLCDFCNKNIERINLDDFCFDCGYEKSECVCKYNVYRFNSVISVFKNIDFAQKAYYSYKFGRKQHCSKFFAEQISDAVKSYYKEIKFDCICYVPSYKRHQYNHSLYIAEDVCEIMSIPLDKDLLKCVKKTKKQHKSSIKERLNNVDGKYFAEKNIDGKTILLIDDIKTTGATLDECSKVLLFARADSVYCATALGSVSHKNIMMLLYNQK